MIKYNEIALRIFKKKINYVIDELVTKKARKVKFLSNITV